MTHKQYLDYEFYVCENHRNKFKHNVWHWKYIPEEELENCGFITDYNRIRLNRIEKRKEGENSIREYGLDGLILDSKGNYPPIGFANGSHYVLSSLRSQ